MNTRRGKSNRKRVYEVLMCSLTSLAIKSCINVVDACVKPGLNVTNQVLVVVFFNNIKVYTVVAVLIYKQLDWEGFSL